MELKKINDHHYELMLNASFDATCHQDFHEHIKSALLETGATLEINFSKVTYIDSSALGMLLLARQEAMQHSGSIILTKLKKGNTLNILKLVKFDKLFPIQETV